VGGVFYIDSLLICKIKRFYRLFITTVEKINMEEVLIMAERKLNRDELIVLVTRIMTAEGKTEAENDQLLEEFLDNVIDPEAANYIFYDNLLPEEVVDKALSYKPIRL
jgi:hypothetical protein